jgi:AhpC/TSA family
MNIGRRKLLLAVGVLAAIVAAVSVGAALRTSSPQARVEFGMPAPPLAGTAVRGGSVRLDELRGRVVLLSFLNSRAEATSQGDPSRAQIVFLRSMQRQHARFGLRVIVVDAAELAGAGRPTRSDLVNYTYDLNLDPTIAVLPDDGSLARRFGVDHAPTTFLIGRGGVVRERWNGFVAAARLDFALRRLEGRSAPG